MATQSHKADPLEQASKTLPRYKVIQVAFPGKEDLTLDPDTAHPQLEISEDGKVVKCGCTPRQICGCSDRFDVANCVVAKQSFKDGQHYWEVFVGQKLRWNLGVISANAERQGKLIKCSGAGEVCTKGYWMIGYDDRKAEKKYKASGINSMSIDCGCKPHTIGVYLDYPGREVTFFNADDPNNLTPLYSFYNADFEEAPVYPFFDTCNNDSGNNQPLQIV